MNDGETDDKRATIRPVLQRAAVMTHVAVRITKMDESLDFYRCYAGLHVVHERVDDGIRVAWLSHRMEDPDFVVVLLEMPHERMAEPSATDHFGLAVESREEVDRIGERAKQDGILKYGPVYAGPVVGYFVMVRDPSGNTCEFSHGQPINPHDLQ